MCDAFHGRLVLVRIHALRRLLQQLLILVSETAHIRKPTPVVHNLLLSRLFLLLLEGLIPRVKIELGV